MPLRGYSLRHTFFSEVKDIFPYASLQLSTITFNENSQKYVANCKCIIKLFEGPHMYVIGYLKVFNAVTFTGSY